MMDDRSPCAPATTIVVDTNCFIQGRDLKDMPWCELIPGVRRVEVAVLPTVVDELDELKAARSKRVRDRSRLALQLIRQASQEPDMGLLLRETSEVSVTLIVADVGRVDWDGLMDLDPARPDDRIVAEAMSYAVPGPKVLLTHDTGPLLRGRRVGLQTRELPENWLLPPASDETEREIARLRRENDELRNRAARLEVAWLEGDEPFEELRVERLLVPPLGEAAIRALIERTKATLPPPRGIFTPGLGFLIDGCRGFTQDDHQRFHAEYQRFLTALPRFFEKLHERVSSASATKSVGYRVSNLGTTAAEGLSIVFEVDDDWLLFGDRKSADEFYGVSVVPPSPPELSSSRSALLTSIGAVRPVSAIPKMRDPEDFRWKHRPRAGDRHGSLQCAEFRAKRVWNDTLWVHPWNDDVTTATLSLDVHHRTGSSPIELALPMRVVKTETDWNSDDVRALADGWLNDVLSDPFR